MTKCLVVNADDFGYTQGVNRGIVDAHVNGIVSSTSLMVDSIWAEEAVGLAKSNPGLGIGLHFVATNATGPLFDLSRPEIVRAELDRQYETFCTLMGRQPTHIDSHQHVHFEPDSRKSVFVEWANTHQLPLRKSGDVHFNGAFFGHSYDEEWRPHPALDLISVENLEQILRALPSGVTELACHPGYFTPDLDAYAVEREAELATLIDPRIRDLIRELGIEVINFGGLRSNAGLLACDLLP